MFPPSHPDAASPTVPTALRPVTPLGIIAQNLTSLVDRAHALLDAPPEFVQLLVETMQLADGFDPYLETCSTPRSAVLADLEENTAQLDWPALYEAGSTSLALEAEMVSGHIEGQFLNFLIRCTGSLNVLEIGLFTGYSALAMAEALPAGGRLVACEIDAYAARYAQSWFDRSPHGTKIRIEVAPAIETLARLDAAGETFDFIFIDADKPQYRTYLEFILGSELLTAGGLICVDNTLLQGQPYLPGVRSENGRAIADFNAFVAADPRVEQVLLPIRDGLTFIRRAVM